MITESYDEAFYILYSLSTPIDLKVNEEAVLFRPERNGWSVILPKRKIVTANEIKRLIEKYNPKLDYSLKLHPSNLVITWSSDPLVRFRKKSFHVNYYGISTPEKTYSFYKELIRDILKMYEPEIKIEINNKL